MSDSLLRIPPFPGHRAGSLAQAGAGPIDSAVNSLAEALRAARVGGSFWAAQPVLAPGQTHLLAPDTPQQLATMLQALPHATATILAPKGWRIPRGFAHIPHPCDPWWLAEQASAIWAGAGQELALVAALAGCPLRVFGGDRDGGGRFAGCDTAPAAMLATELARWSYTNPFTAKLASTRETIALLADWRRLIDSNRPVTAIYGVALWKRVTLDALLWDGTGPVRHARALPATLLPGGQVIAWKSRTSPRLLARLEAHYEGWRVVGELEDGMIRSTGLGANCVPPLSAIVDFSGVYFDPSGPSDLEAILETTDIAPSLCQRAAALRQSLVASAISKYGQGGTTIARPTDHRRRVLVTGQVEDDRSMLSGGAGCTNLALIRRARALEADAWIIYKPHPDVEAGHRKGHVPDTEALRFADEVQRDAAIIPLIDSVDALHVITSLAGFEALLRGKAVTTHGVPFYAGWGLTRDLAPMPPRRTRPRALDELVAATLLLYPRYLDPVTRLPCPAEVVVARMAAGEALVSSPLIALREWQGRACLLLRGLALRRLMGAR